RVDSGVVEGDVIGGAFDSLLGKLIITGHTRQEALERARRALDEFVIEGMPTVLPFDRAVVADPAFAPTGDQPFTIHTRWIETDFDNQIAPYTGPLPESGEPPAPRQALVVEVGGKRLEVTLPGDLQLGSTGDGNGARKKAPKRSRSGGAAAAASGDSLTAPMQGTIVKVAVSDGDTAAEGDTIIVIEAMKMEQPITAHKAGTITGLTAQVGQTVTAGTVLAEIKD
ncbi:biotin/lipoyl-containing protein, partial [Leekyejoonella antrihumi]